MTLLVTCGFTSLAAAASVEEALKYVPVQNEVEYDRPSANEIAKCTIKSEQVGKFAAWVVYGAAGQKLRVFADTNNDNNVDRWSYYLNGIECYRDVDSNYDGKVDQYRWLGLSGTRWGVDDNQDGTLDRWQAISAEEVSSEALAAIRDKDAVRFGRLLITPNELRSLGAGETLSKRIAGQLSTAPQRFNQLVASQRAVGPRSKWVHFGATQPGVLPAGTDGSTDDLVVYENVSAMIENAGEHGQLAVGTLLKVGDTWRMIDIPTGLMEEDVRLAASYVFQPSVEQPELPADEGAISEEARELVAKLNELETQLRQARSPQEKAANYEEQGKVLRTLASGAKTKSDQVVWIRQLADTLGTAAQAGDYPAGLKKLRELRGELERQSKDADITAHVAFVSIMTEYSVALMREDADFAAIQETWIEQLTDYADAYANSPNAPEALLQLAIAQEFAGNDEEAVARYREILAMRPEGMISKKAQGALRRLEGVGKPLQIGGRTAGGKRFDISQLKGKVVALHYWASWSAPSVADMSGLEKLVAKYGTKFTPVGVNLDSSTEDLRASLAKVRASWPQLFEQGGLESPLALQLGILTVPTMILIDEEGSIVNRNAQLADVEDYLSKVR
ncbi:MAG: thioredoxin-like domain-containing protein [Pseudomonadota bacterium]